MCNAEGELESSQLPPTKTSAVAQPSATSAEVATVAEPAPAQSPPDDDDTSEPVPPVGEEEAHSGSQSKLAEGDEHYVESHSQSDVVTGLESGTAEEVKDGDSEALTEDAHQEDEATVVVDAEDKTESEIVNEEMKQEDSVEDKPQVTEESVETESKPDEAVEE